MSFYDDASIVMIPSGYKASKLYSAKPTDGTGDLTFTRTGSTATRVIESGLIEKCLTNLVLNSATLATQNVTVVAAPYTLSIFGTGSVTLSGTGTGTLTGTGAANRVSLTFTPTAGTLTITVAGSVTSAQLEIGDIATAYIPTAAAAVTVGPIANLPRLDYTGGGCPKLLIEPARTNLLTYSEEISSVGGWSKLGGAGTVTSTNNYGIGPDGYQSSTRLVFSAASLIWKKTISGLIGNSAIFSIWIKGTPGQTILITCGGLSDIVVTLTSNFVRYNTITGTCTTNDILINTYGGATARDIEVWGAQVELGTYATSYIPTQNASVTRNQDRCIRTGASALIGQIEGSVIIDYQPKAISPISVDDIYSNNKNLTGSISIQSSINGNIEAVICYNGVFFKLSSAIGTVQVNQRYKIGLGYKSGDCVFYINGVQITSNNTAFAFTTTLSEIDIANNAVFFGEITSKNTNQVTLFKTRLSNADLATLTTL